MEICFPLYIHTYTVYCVFATFLKAQICLFKASHIQMKVAIRVDDQGKERKILYAYEYCMRVLCKGFAKLVSFK